MSLHIHDGHKPISVQPVDPITTPSTQAITKTATNIIPNISYKPKESINFEFNKNLSILNNDLALPSELDDLITSDNIFGSMLALGHTEDKELDFTTAFTLFEMLNSFPLATPSKEEQQAIDQCKQIREFDKQVKNFQRTLAKDLEKISGELSQSKFELNKTKEDQFRVFQANIYRGKYALTELDSKAIQAEETRLKREEQQEINKILKKNDEEVKEKYESFCEDIIKNISNLKEGESYTIHVPNLKYNTLLELKKEASGCYAINSYEDLTKINSRDLLNENNSYRLNEGKVYLQPFKEWKEIPSQKINIFFLKNLLKPIFKDSSDSRYEYIPKENHIERCMIYLKDYYIKSDLSDSKLKIHKFGMQNRNNSELATIFFKNKFSQDEGKTYKKAILHLKFMFLMRCFQKSKDQLKNNDFEAKKLRELFLFSSKQLFKKIAKIEDENENSLSSMMNTLVHLQNEIEVVNDSINDINTRIKNAPVIQTNQLSAKNNDVFNSIVQNNLLEVKAPKNTAYEPIEVKLIKTSVEVNNLSLAEDMSYVFNKIEELGFTNLEQLDAFGKIALTAECQVLSSYAIRLRAVMAIELIDSLADSINLDVLKKSLIDSKFTKDEVNNYPKQIRQLINAYTALYGIIHYGAITLNVKKDESYKEIAQHELKLSDPIEDIVTQSFNSTLVRRMATMLPLQSLTHYLYNTKIENEDYRYALQRPDFLFDNLVLNSIAGSAAYKDRINSAIASMYQFNFAQEGKESKNKVIRLFRSSQELRNLDTYNKDQKGQYIAPTEFNKDRYVQDQKNLSDYANTGKSDCVATSFKSGPYKGASYIGMKDEGPTDRTFKELYTDPNFSNLATLKQGYDAFNRLMSQDWKVANTAIYKVDYSNEEQPLSDYNYNHQYIFIPTYKFNLSYDKVNLQDPSQDALLGFREDTLSFFKYPLKSETNQINLLEHLFSPASDKNSTSLGNISNTTIENLIKYKIGYKGIQDVDFQTYYQIMNAYALGLTTKNEVQNSLDIENATKIEEIQDIHPLLFAIRYPALAISSYQNFLVQNIRKLNDPAKLSSLLMALKTILNFDESLKDQKGLLSFIQYVASQMETLSKSSVKKNQELCLFYFEISNMLNEFMNNKKDLIFSDEIVEARQKLDLTYYIANLKKMGNLPDYITVLIKLQTIINYQVRSQELTDDEIADLLTNWVSYKTNGIENRWLNPDAENQVKKIVDELEWEKIQETSAIMNQVGNKVAKEFFDENQKVWKLTTFAQIKASDEYIDLRRGIVVKDSSAIGKLKKPPKIDNNFKRLFPTMVGMTFAGNKDQVWMVHPQLGKYQMKAINEDEYDIFKEIEGKLYKYIPSEKLIGINNSLKDDFLHWIAVDESVASEKSNYYITDLNHKFKYGLFDDKLRSVNKQGKLRDNAKTVAWAVDDIQQLSHFDSMNNILFSDEDKNGSFKKIAFTRYLSKEGLPLLFVKKEDQFVLQNRQNYAISNQRPKTIAGISNYLYLTTKDKKPLVLIPFKPFKDNELAIENRDQCKTAGTVEQKNGFQYFNYYYDVKTKELTADTAEEKLFLAYIKISQKNYKEGNTLLKTALTQKTSRSDNFSKIMTMIVDTLNEELKSSPHSYDIYKTNLLLYVSFILQKENQKKLIEEDRDYTSLFERYLNTTQSLHNENLFDVNEELVFLKSFPIRFNDTIETKAIINSRINLLENIDNPDRVYQLGAKDPSIMQAMTHKNGTSEVAAEALVKTLIKTASNVDKTPFLDDYFNYYEIMDFLIMLANAKEKTENFEAEILHVKTKMEMGYPKNFSGNDNSLLNRIYKLLLLDHQIIKKISHPFKESFERARAAKESVDQGLQHYTYDGKSSWLNESYGSSLEKSFKYFFDEIDKQPMPSFNNIKDVAIEPSAKSRKIQIEPLSVIEQGKLNKETVSNIKLEDPTLDNLKSWISKDAFKEIAVKQPLDLTSDNPEESFKKQLEETIEQYQIGMQRNYEKARTSNVNLEEANQLNEDLKNKITILEEQLIKSINYRPNKDEIKRLRHEAAYLSGFNQKLTVFDCLTCLLSTDQNIWFKLNPYLDQTQVNNLIKDILELQLYKMRSIQMEDIINLQTEINELQKIDDANNAIKLTKLNKLLLDRVRANIPLEKFSLEQLKVMLVYAGETGIILRDEQVHVLENLFKLEADNNQKQASKVIELIMGGGKTSVIAAIFLKVMAIKKLAFFTVPEQLFEPVVGNLDNVMQSTYKHPIFKLNVKRKELTKEKIIEINAMIKEAKKKGIPIVTTPVTLHVLELEMLHLRKNSAKGFIYNSLKSILADLKNPNKATQLIDEIDLVLAVNEETIFPEGDKIAIDQSRNLLLRQIYEILVSKNEITIKDEKWNIDATKSIGEWLQLEKNKQQDLPLEVLQKNIIPVVAEEIVAKNDILKNYINSEDKEILAKYIKYLITTDPEDIDNNAFIDALEQKFLIAQQQEIGSNSVILESINQLALARHFLTELLPATLQQTANKNYGMNPNVYNEVIPYKSVDEPSTAKFGYHWENAAKTYQMGIYAPEKGEGLISREFIRNLFKNAIEQALYYMQQRPNTETTIQQTLEYRQILDELDVDISTMLKEEDKNSIVIDEELVEKAYQKLLNPENIAKRINYTQTIINSHVSYHTKRKVANGRTLTSMVTSSGMSGTPWNRKGYGRDLQDFVPDAGAEFSVIEKMREKDVKVNKTSFSTLEGFLKDTLQNNEADEGNAKGKVRGILDAAGRFSEFGANEVVASDIMQFLANHPKYKHVEGVLFFNKDHLNINKTDFGNNTLYIWKKGDKRPIRIGGTTKEALEKVGFADPEKYFFYGDQSHTTGVDINQAGNAINIITGSGDLLRRDLTQAVMRLRDFKLHQNVQVVFSQQDIDSYFKGEIPSIDQVVRLFNDNQLIEDTESMVKYFKVEINNVFRNQYLNIILGLTSDLKELPDEIKQILSSPDSVTYLDQLEEIIITHFSDNPYMQFGRKNENQLTKDMLINILESKNEKFISIINEWKECVNNTAFKEFLEKITGNLEQEVREATNYIEQVNCLPKHHSTKQVNIGREVEQQEEEEQEQEVEEQVDVNEQLNERNALKAELAKHNECQFQKYEVKKPFDEATFIKLLDAVIEGEEKEDRGYISIKQKMEENDLTKPFVDVFDNSKVQVYGTDTFFYPVGKEHDTNKKISFFHNLQKLPYHSLVIKTEKNGRSVIKVLMLTEAEASAAKIYLDKIQASEENIKYSNVLLINELGLDLNNHADSTRQNFSKSDEIDIKEALVQMHVLAGRTVLLNQIPANTRRWLSGANRDVKWKFLSLSAIKNQTSFNMLSTGLAFVQSNSGVNTFFSLREQHELVTLGEIKVRSYEEASQLNEADIEFVDKESIKFLKGTQIEFVRAAQVPYLSALQIRQLPSSKVPYITHVTQILMDQLKKENDQIIRDKEGNFILEKICILNKEQIAELTIKQAKFLKYLSIEQVRYLTQPWVVQYLTIDQLGGIENALASDIPIEIIKKFNKNHIALIKKIESIISAKEKLKALPANLKPYLSKKTLLEEGYFSKEDLAQIDDKEAFLELLTKIELQGDLSDLTKDQISWLPKEYIERLGAEDARIIEQLTIEQVQYLIKPEAIALLLPTQMAGIVETQVKYLKDQQIPNCPVHLVNGVNKQQIKLLNKKQIPYLNVSNITEINRSLYMFIHENIVKEYGPLNLKKYFEISHTKSIWKKWVNLIQPEDVSKLAKEEISLLQEEILIKAVSKDYIKHVKGNFVKFVNKEYVNEITQDQIFEINNRNDLYLLRDLNGSMYESKWINQINPKLACILEPEHFKLITNTELQNQVALLNEKVQKKANIELLTAQQKLEEAVLLEKDTLEKLAEQQEKIEQLAKAIESNEQALIEKVEESGNYPSTSIDVPSKDVETKESGNEKEIPKVTSAVGVDYQEDLEVIKKQKQALEKLQKEQSQTENRLEGIQREKTETKKQVVEQSQILSNIDNNRDTLDQLFANYTDEQIQTITEPIVLEKVFENILSIKGEKIFDAKYQVLSEAQLENLSIGLKDKYKELKNSSDDKKISTPLKFENLVVQVAKNKVSLIPNPLVCLVKDESEIKDMSFWQVSYMTEEQLAKRTTAQKVAFAFESIILGIFGTAITAIAYSIISLLNLITAGSLEETKKKLGKVIKHNNTRLSRVFQGSAYQPKIDVK